jgi:5-dehydro-2-deoxygluconokinase
MAVDRLTADSGAGLDLLTMGRVGVDLYPEQIGVPLAEVTTFRKMLGGSPTNVAVAAARLGLSSGVITAVGRDGFGTYVRAALSGFGVRTDHVIEHMHLRTPLAFCEIHPPDHFPLLFYREPMAPDLTIDVSAVDLDAVTVAGTFWTTGTGLTVEPSRSATLAALEARSGRAHTIHDLDHRSSLWPQLDEARRWQREALRHATVVVGSRTEVAVVVDDTDPRAAANALLDLGPSLAIVKLGPEGVLAATRDEVRVVEPIAVDVVNGLGAGDAFGGALCFGLCREWPLVDLLHLANAAGALVATRLGCADAMPELVEIEELRRRVVSTG